MFKSILHLVHWLPNDLSVYIFLCHPTLNKHLWLAMSGTLLHFSLKSFYYFFFFGELQPYWVPIPVSCPFRSSLWLSQGETTLPSLSTDCFSIAPATLLCKYLSIASFSCLSHRAPHEQVLGLAISTSLGCNTPMVPYQYLMDECMTY